MDFGSEKTFSLIKRVLYEQDVYAEEELYRIIYDDVLSCLHSRIIELVDDQSRNREPLRADETGEVLWTEDTDGQPEKTGLRQIRNGSGIPDMDLEEIVHDVIWRILRSLPRFYERFADQTEDARNAYLKKAARNARAGYFRKLYINKRTEAQEKADGAGKKPENDGEKWTFVDIDNEMNKLNSKLIIEDHALQTIDRETFFEALMTIFSLKTTPDKKLAFVFGRLFPALSNTQGSPEAILEIYDREHLVKMYEDMEATFRDVWDEGLPDRVLAPLREEVYGAYLEEVFHMTPHQITDSSTWIRKKMKEMMIR